MSKSGKKIDNRQLSIFDYLRKLAEEEPKPPVSGEGKFRCIDRLRASIRDAIKASPLSRFQIAGEMSHLLGENITKEIIDSWTRESDEINGRPARHIPAEYLPAFCRVTRCNEPLIVLGQMVGLFVLPGPEALRAEIQKLDEEIRKTQAQKKKRMMFLKEMESKRS